MPPPRHPPSVAPVTAAAVSWNSAKTLAGCLASLLGQSRRPAQVILVDNASADQSLEIARGFAGVEIVANSKNVGFAAAVNQAWAKSAEPWLFCVNPDLRLDSFYLARLLLVLEANPSAGSGQGKLLRMTPSGEPCSPALIDSAGIRRRFWGAQFVDLGGGEPDRGQYGEPGEIFGPCAAAALYRREMIEQVSPDGKVFDEDFFAYAEDVDLAWRARRAGWKSLYEPSAVGWHVRGGSKLPSPRLEQLLYRNRLWTLAKNASWGELLRLAPGLLPFEAAKLAQALTVKPYLREVFWERFRGWPQMRAKRSALRPLPRRGPGGGP